jgi:peptide/nickel transport system permease protein
MGADQFGRDVLSRLLYGGRLTIGLGFLAVFIGAVAGVAIGLFAGLGGYSADLLVMRVVDLFMAFPTMLLALMIVAARGPGTANMTAAVGISLIPIYVRVVRAAVFSLREQAYVEAAKAIGCGSIHVAVRHILPNLGPSILVLSTVAIGWAIVLGSALSFLGLGPQAPTPEWGVDLANGRNYLKAAWWISTFPGLAIMITVLSVNLVGDGLRDLLDPRLRGTSNL